MKIRGVKTRHGEGYASLEKKARNLREKLCPDIAIDEAIPGLQLFYSLEDHKVSSGSTTVPLTYGVRDDLPPGVEGLTTFVQADRRVCVNISEEGYRGLHLDDGRSRFSLCHEIIHAFEHVYELLTMAQLPHHALALVRFKEPTHKDFEDSEWQANAGAAALLMPARGLLALEKRKGELTIANVVSNFDVSAHSAGIRIAVFTTRRSELLAA